MGLLDQALFALTIICDFPLSAFIRKYCTPIKRLYFHILFGFIICIFLYRQYFIYVMVGVLASYALMFLPGILCLSSMLIPFCGLVSIHYYKLHHVGEWGSDVSGLIMFSFLRIWSLSFNIYDGHKNMIGKIKRKQWLEAAISKPPPLLQYLAYIFSYNGLYSGAVLPFKDFIATAELNSSDEMISQDIWSGFPYFLGSILICGVYGAGVPFFPANLILSEEKFENKNYFYRLIISIILSAIHTSRYIFAWIGAEAGWRTLGAARINKEYISSIIPSKYYSSRKLSDLAIEWNRSIHFILKEYLHVRLISIGVPNFIARIATFSMSAIWHGFYSGYYLFAGMEAVFGILDEFRYKWFSSFLESIIGHNMTVVFDCIWVQCLNYFMGAPWDLYWAEHYWHFYVNMKFIPFFVLISMIIVGFAFRKSGLSKNISKKE